ncbi:unnamed protein product [Macrosiphum euphorbiae]|nr:unnamed protein product [Macrosiphum euphorbiae]
MTDFEIGLKNAFSNLYPNATLLSCWFHFVQSLWKNIKRLRYTEYIKNNETAKMCIKMVMVIALLPINEIELGFQDITNHARLNNVDLTRFFNYFTNHWLIRTGPNSFSVYNQPRRINNNIESFHGRMKDKLQVCHPNLWKMLGHLSDCS